MTTTLRDPAFSSYAPQFEEVLGEAPRLALLVDADAHEGPVYFGDENALYFTTLPKPGVDGARRARGQLAVHHHRFRGLGR